MNQKGTGPRNPSNFGKAAGIKEITLLLILSSKGLGGKPFEGVATSNDPGGHSLGIEIALARKPFGRERSQDFRMPPGIVA
jgi:hypothetical protein